MQSEDEGIERQAYPLRLNVQHECSFACRSHLFVQPRFHREKFKIYQAYYPLLSSATLRIDAMPASTSVLLWLYPI